MSMMLSKRLLAGAALSVLIGSGAPALAQESSLEEVVVTANRREENLQQVPIAITAVTAQSLEKNAALRTSDLSNVVPGLSFTMQINGGTPFMRGIGTPSTTVGNEASVALYIDDVYIASPNASVFQFNNVDSMAALKGPQGTLFGRNATGGVLQVRTRDPGQSRRFDLTGTLANYSTKEGAFYGNVPMNDDVAVNLAAYGRKQDHGWGRNLTTGEPTFTGWDWGVRAKALWTPTDATSILLTADMNKARGSRGMGLHVLPGAIAADGATTYGGFYNTYGSPNDYSLNKQSGVSLKVSHDLDAVRLVSITAYRDADSLAQFDQDTTAVPIVDAQLNQRDKSFSQEFQLLSPKASSIQWILGGFYFHDVASYDPLRLQGLAAAPLSYIDFHAVQRTKSLSGYGQATAEVLPDTKLTLGLRYTRDRRGIVGETRGGMPTGPIMLAQAAQKAHWGEWTWRAALDHQFTSSVLGYVSYNRGFKSGAYNAVAYADKPVAPELLDAYEAGLKSEWFDRRLRANIAAFYYDYTNIQVQQVVAGAAFTLNAAAATIKGIDFDITANPIPDLVLQAGGSILRGSYDRFANGPVNVPAPGVCSPVPAQLPGPRTGGNIACSADLSGNRTIRSPKWTLNLSGDYTIPVSFGSFVLSGSYYYNDGFFWTPENRVRERAYQTVNAALRWSSPDKAWDVSVWGRNLGDRKYCEYADSTGLADECAPAAPRTFGVTVGAHF